MKPTDAVRSSTLVALACLLVGIASLASAWYRDLDAGVPPDVQGYLDIAAHMRDPFDTGSREPVIIWLAKLGTLLTPDDRIAPGVAPSVLFLATGLLLFRLVYAYTRELVAPACATLVFLTNHNLADLAQAGYRDTYFCFALVGLTWAVLSPDPWLSTRRRVATAALFTALCCGTRITSLFTVTVFLVYGFWRRRVAWRWLIAPLAAGAITIAPYMVRCAATYGDPFYAGNIHASWWRNYEFVTLERGSCPECPTAAEMEANGPYAGEPTTVFHYVFGMHAPAELAAGIVRGAAAVFLDPRSPFFIFLVDPPRRPGKEAYSSTVSLMFAVPIFVGLLGSLRRPVAELALVAPFFLNVLLFTTSIGMPYRLFAPAAPFLAAGWGLGAARLAELAGARARRDPA